MLGPSCALLQHAGARDERDCGSPGVESVQRQLLPQNAMRLQGSCGHTRSLGALQDHPEPARSIGQDRNHHGKRRSRPPAHSSTTETRAGSRDIDPRWRLCGERCQHVFGSPVRDQLRHVRNLLKPRSRATTDSLHNQRSDALEVSVGCPRNRTRRCRYAYR